MWPGLEEAEGRAPMGLEELQAYQCPPSTGGPTALFCVFPWPCGSLPSADVWLLGCIFQILYRLLWEPTWTSDHVSQGIAGNVVPVLLSDPVESYLSLCQEDTLSVPIPLAATTPALFPFTEGT